MAKWDVKKNKPWRYIPEFDEQLMWKCGGHAIYDDFPWGNRVDREKLGIDFYDHVSAPVVVAVRTDSIRRWHKGKKKWHESEYVAVQFEVANRFVWTNFSRDGEQWLWTASEMRAWLGED